MSYTAKPAISITELHEAIKTKLKASTLFTGWNVDYYARPGDQIKTPAILIELDSIQPGENGTDLGNGQADVVLTFNAYIVQKFSDKDQSKLFVRQAAANLCAFLTDQRWGKAVKRAQFIGADPDALDGDPKEYEVMRIDWSHEALLGVDYFTPSGETPDTVETDEQGAGYEQIIPVE